MIIRLALILFTVLISQIARAGAITPYLEMVKVTSVGSDWKPVPLVNNSYSIPIIACTYALPSSSDNEAVVRVQAAPTGVGFQVKLQHPIQSTDVTAGDVYCTISEEGSYSYPIKYEAYKVSSDGTNYGSDWGVDEMENVTTSKALTYSQPVVIGQVMTYKNDHFSVFWSNNCVTRGTPATNNAVCVGKHTGQVNPNIPNAEDIGYFIAEEAEYFMESANVKIARGADTVAGVGNSPPYSYDLGRTYTLATASTSAEDGGNGGWTVLYGNNPVSQDLNLAIDEETTTGDQTRKHTNEQISYWAMKPIDHSTPRANLIINEILYRGTTSLREFVELYATTDGSIENYVVSGRESGQNVYLPELTVAKGDYVILHFGVGTDNSVDNVHHLYSGSNSSVFLDGGDDLLLLKPSILDYTDLQAFDSDVIIGFPVDYVAYGSSNSIDPVSTSHLGVTVSWNAADQARLAGAASGQSISLTLNGADTDTSECWELTTSGGAANCTQFIVTYDSDTSSYTNSQGFTNNFGPILALEKSVLTIYDPFNGASNPKAIPGSILEYTITASNSGPAAADAGVIRITDAIPAGTKLCVSNSGFCLPPYFVPETSGLALGTVVYSTTGGGSGSYGTSTSPDGEGVDSSITHLSAPTIGEFQPLTNGNASTFSLKFRVMVQ